MSNSRYDGEMYQQMDRGMDAARAFTDRLGLPAMPRYMIDAAIAAERGPVPTAEAKVSPYWPEFFRRHRDQFADMPFGQTYLDEFAEADARMDELIAADRARRKATADADKAAKAEAERVDTERRTEEYDELVATVRRRYMSLPGTSEPGFLLALPGLIEDERRRLLVQHATADDIARERQRQRTRL